MKTYLELGHVAAPAVFTGGDGWIRCRDRCRRSRHGTRRGVGWIWRIGVWRRTVVLRGRRCTSTHRNILATLLKPREAIRTLFRHGRGSSRSISSSRSSSSRGYFVFCSKTQVIPRLWPEFLGVLGLLERWCILHFLALLLCQELLSLRLLGTPTCLDM